MSFELNPQNIWSASTGRLSCEFISIDITYICKASEDDECIEVVIQ